MVWFGCWQPLSSCTSGREDDLWLTWPECKIFCILCPAQSEGGQGLLLRILYSSPKPECVCVFALCIHILAFLWHWSLTTTRSMFLFFPDLIVFKKNLSMHHHNNHKKSGTKWVELDELDNKGGPSGRAGGGEWVMGRRRRRSRRGDAWGGTTERVGGRE